MMGAAFKKTLNNIKDCFICNSSSKYTRFLYFSCVFLIIISTFLTIIFQAPFFVTHNFNSFVAIFWALCLIPLLFINYKLFLKNALIVIAFLLPFILYLLIAAVFGTNSFSSSLTRTILLSVLVLFIGTNLRTIFYEKHYLLIAFSFSIASILLASIIYVQYLRGYDLSNQIYAYSSKNSAGPILFCGIIAMHYGLKKLIIPNRTNKICKSVVISTDFFVYVFLAIIIALMKCRTMILCIPVLLFFLVFDWFKRLKIRLIFIFSFVISIFLLFVVPPIRDAVILKIFLNNKTDDLLSTLFSGRIETIIIAFQNWKVLLGDGKTYVDCMPVAIICSFGIIGTISLLPIFYLLIKLIKSNKSQKRDEKKLIYILVFTFIFDSLMEGFGLFGPGAKVFMFWLFLGILSDLSKSSIITFRKKAINIDIKMFNLIENKYFGKFIRITPVLLLLSASLFVAAYNPSSNFLSTSIYEMIPSKNKSVDYVLPESIKLSVPDYLIVGQEITFAASVEPYNVTDSEVTWRSYNNGILEINPETGICRAKSIGSVTVAASSLRSKHIYSEKVVRVIANKDYSFDNFIISPFNSKFEKENYSFVYNKNKTFKLYYDLAYCPEPISVSYVVDNTNVCYVDDFGIVRCVNPGTAIIQGLITIDDKTIYSANYLTVDVEEEIITPANSLDFTFPEEIYEKDEINILPVFNNGTAGVDDSFFVECSDNIKFDSCSGVALFAKSGVGYFNIVSTSNTSIKKSYQIEVRNIKPLKFICNDNWWVLGDVRRANIDLLYDNGKTHPVELSDINHPAREYEDRAYFNKNGIANDYLTRAAIITNNITIRLKSIKDLTVTCSFSIRVNQYTIDQYRQNIHFCSIVLSNVILSIFVVAIFVIKKINIFIKFAFSSSIAIALNIINSILIHNFFMIFFTLIELSIIIFIVFYLRSIKKDRLTIFNSEIISRVVTEDEILELTI